MQVYKTFFKIARSYKTGILMYLGIVVVMLVLIVVSSRNTGDRVAYEQASYDILLVDQDHSEVSELLAEYLGTVHTLKEGSYSEDQIMDMLYYQSITEYIVIPEGFGDAYLNGAFREDYVGTGESIQAVYDEALPMGIFVNMQINESGQRICPLTVQLRNLLQLRGDWPAENAADFSVFYPNRRLWQTTGRESGHIC